MNTRGSPEENTVQGYLEDIEKGPRKVRHEEIGRASCRERV